MGTSTDDRLELRFGTHSQGKHSGRQLLQKEARLKSEAITPTHRAADVTLRCCCCSNSRFKHCYPGNSRDESELHSSGVTHSRLPLSVSLLPVILLKSLLSLLVPVRAAALCTVDGGSGGEALRPAGERRSVSTCRGFGAVRPVVHGGGCGRASGAHLGAGLHVGGPRFACQQVSLSSSSLRRKGLTFLCPATGTLQHTCGIKIQGGKT